MGLESTLAGGLEHKHGPRGWCWTCASLGLHVDARTL
jgi:hypothetical protein